MMRLTTMWAVERTIDAKGMCPIAEEILARWAHDPEPARLFRSSANFLFTFQRAGTRHFLRFAADSDRSRAAIEAETRLLDWLGETGLTVNLPVRSCAGDAVETVRTASGTFHAVAFAALDGDHRDLDDLDEAGFRRWGAALGELHAALKHYPAALSDRPSWQDHLAFIEGTLAENDPGPRRELEQIGEALAVLPKTPDTYGLIHFDFELDNILWQDGAIGMLDFDDAAHYWYVADIAFALRDLFADGVDLDDPSFQAFVAGYRTFYRLDPESLLQVPLFLRLAKLFTHAKIARSLVDLPSDGEHPEWLTGLIHRFEARLAAYRASLTRSGG